MAVYDTLNDRQKEAVFCTEGPLFSSGGSRIRKDQGADAPHCISD